MRQTASHKAFAAPDLTGQSIMLVAPQSIEATLVARRLQRWGGQTCMVSDIAVAQALLPERTWHARADRPRARRRGGRSAWRSRARPCHAADRDVHAGRAARAEMLRRGLHRLSGKAAARGLARGAADDGAGSRRAGPRRRSPDRAGRRDEDHACAGARALDPGRRGQRDQRAVDALAADAARPSRRHHHQWRGGAGILAVGANPPARLTTSC